MRKASTGRAKPHVCDRGQSEPLADADLGSPPRCCKKAAKFPEAVAPAGGDLGTWLG